MKIALVQMCSTPDIEANLSAAAAFAKEASAHDADWIVFPENVAYLGPDAVSVVQPLGGTIVAEFKGLARSCNCFVTVGSFPEVSEVAEKCYNTQLLISPEGEVVAIYRKIHLFDVMLSSSEAYRESDRVLGGKSIIHTSVTVNNETWIAGLSICYDLRFPELYRKLVECGTTVMVIPAAFTFSTGAAHWHALLKARAIENQCYILAPNQVGVHYDNRRSFGNSVVYDPWGTAVATASDRPGLCYARIDLSFVNEVRGRIPALSHRVF
jgi:predicted amidohydrolase